MPPRPRLGGAGRTARYLQHWERVLMGSGGLEGWSIGASHSHILTKPSNLVLKPQLNEGFCLVVWGLSCYWEEALTCTRQSNRGHLLEMGGAGHPQGRLQ